MKLKDKETGAILDDCSISLKNKWGAMAYDPPKTLKELNERFEDVEETKDFQYIMEDGNIDLQEDDNSIFSNNLKQIGNYFETFEEAEKAVEKLKAWKRLKDKGFTFTDWEKRSIWAGLPSVKALEHLVDIVGIFPDNIDEFRDDLDLLFGGKE